ncbi:MAG: hypothetical protein ACSHXK_11475, partial [Oceanococcus sp.]
MKLENEVRELTFRWVAKGGKHNRRQQRNRMQAFVKHAAKSGAKSLAQVGKQHVIRYWKANRDLSDRTLYEHYRAISILWDLAQKAEPPPKPLTLSKSCGDHN